MREIYGRRVDFDERCAHQTKARDASEALVAGNYELVLVLTDDLLKECPVDADFHLWRGAALFSIGRDSEGELHKRWYLGLIQSILDSGDGTSAESAYVTISTGEEYSTLSYLRLTPQQQFLVEGPPMVDAISVEDESGEQSTVYFNPALHFLRLAESLQ